MISLKTTQNGLSIHFGQLAVLTHSLDQPYLSIGRGQGTYSMDRGNFTIEENLSEKIPLTEYEILEQKEERVMIRFSNQKLWAVIVEFIAKGNFLEIMFTDEDESASLHNRFWIRMPASHDECIYGCGEQFSELNLRGKKVPLWVSEQGTGRNKKTYTTFQADTQGKGGGDWYTTYFPQPTFVSTSRYFCHVEDSHYMEFDFRNPSYHELAIWGIPQKIVIGTGPTMLALLEQLTGYLGRQPELPDWAYDGVWLGLQGGTEIVLDKLKKAQEHGLKVTALWCQDWQGKRITSFGKQLMWNWKYDENMYPDLPETIRQLNAQGIRFLGYINPYLAVEGHLFKEASEKGYLVKNKAGEDYLVVSTTFPFGTVDLTNPAAFEWIKNVIKQNMIGIGLSGWMADFAEYLPTDAVLFAGDAEELHNRWPALWAKANREAVEEAGKLGEAAFFTRSGYSGTSRYSTMMWAGDQMVDWSLDDGLPSVIPAALSLGYSGFGISHSDIGGYTSLFGVKRTKELFMRWAEHAAFTPIMRTHEGNRPDDCWQFDSDEETLLHFARMSRIYTKLKPYLKEAVKENALRGIPVMRHPYLHYEDDKELHTLKYQYLLGRDLLVAPVIEENKETWRAYLPQDTWVHLWSGQEYGGGYWEVPAALGFIPVFYRKSSPYRALFEEIKKI
ncbi:MAG: family 31 glycosyl hydrolase, alpha-glucosidase [Peptococcaceae bacterium]|jgi:alpha-glucosidase|nr:family 31 glycosyl hydrolase, alpha-glucosidase [Peptococcaceae bacterium]